MAACRAKVVCTGGSIHDVELFVKRLHDRIHVSRASGNATGRNIRQKFLNKAVRMCNVIYAITVDGKTVDEAMIIYTKA